MSQRHPAAMRGHMVHFVSCLSARKLTDRMRQPVPHMQPFKRENKRTRARDAARAAAPAATAGQATAPPAQQLSAAASVDAAEAAATTTADFVFAEPVLDVAEPAVAAEDPLQACPCLMMAKSVLSRAA